MRKPLLKARQLLLLAYLLAAVLWVVRCLVGCGVMLNYKLQGKMPQTHVDAAELVTESFAPYSSNEWWTPPDDDPAWYLSTDSDPHIYWQGQGYIETVVLDEADRMLDMGFFDDVTKILNRIKNRVNLGLFSATISQEVMTVSWMYQRDEVEITVAPTAESKPDIDQYSITVPRLEKEEATLRILRSGVFERVIIFCNTKVMCQNLSDALRRSGIQADCLHGDIKQATREKTMAAFRKGKLPVLVATDVASRGIDVDDVDAVINYDVPDENEYYIHRIGRTGRARKKGISFTLIGSLPERVKLDEIAKFAEFHITPMIFDEYGCLVPAPVEEKHPPRKRF